MADLLTTVVAAHGGLERWRRIRTIAVDASITGAIWHIKGTGEVLKAVRFEVDTSTQRLTMDFVGQDKRSVFESDRVAIQHADGSPITTRMDPERAFDNHRPDTPWDDLHVAYFSGEALWTYLNAPFLFTDPGFQSEEIAPIEIHGETWRRLKVAFPERIKSHTREQVFCFGADGLLRRHDYTVDILGGAAGMNYAGGYREVEGIMIPTTRRVYPWRGDYERVPEPLLVAIDMGTIVIR